MATKNIYIDSIDIGKLVEADLDRRVREGVDARLRDLGLISDSESGARLRVNGGIKSLNVRS